MKCKDCKYFDELFRVPDNATFLVYKDELAYTDKCIGYGEGTCINQNMNDLILYESGSIKENFGCIFFEQK